MQEAISSSGGSGGSSSSSSSSSSKSSVVWMVMRTLPRKHSGMAHIVKELHSFTCTPIHLSATSMNLPAYWW